MTTREDNSPAKPPTCGLPANMTTERLDDLMRAIRIFQATAGTSRHCAESPWFSHVDRSLREKWLRQASRRERAARRLSQAVAKECDRIKGQYVCFQCDKNE